MPTDGSKLSDRAVQRGIEFAKAVKAKVTAVHAVPEFRMIVEEGFEILIVRTRAADEIPEEIQKNDAANRTGLNMC